MKNYKLKVFIYECLLVFILFFALFVSNSLSKYLLFIFLALYVLGLRFLFNLKKTESIYQKQVTILMIIFALLYVIILYFLGLYSGFFKSKLQFSVLLIFNEVIPIIAIVILSEIIRRYFLSFNYIVYFRRKVIDLSEILAYISAVLLDLSIYAGIYDLTNLDGFLTVLGFVFFFFFSSNLLFQYICRRFGIKCLIFYRLITILYVYFIPFIPNVYIFFQSFLRMVSPYFIYLVITRLYSNSEEFMSYIDRRKVLIGNSFLFIIMTFFIMLISCQFSFGILVIGSRSMTGTIDKGDAVVFEKHTDKSISIGQVIVFKNNDVKTIHRVVDIRRVNGVLRYYTKGDANEKMDVGYITDSDIYGTVLFKIKYIGYPIIWIRSLFES